MKAARLALLLVAVFAIAAFAGPGLATLAGDSGTVDCTTPAPTEESEPEESPSEEPEGEEPASDEPASDEPASDEPASDEPEECETPEEEPEASQPKTEDEPEETDATEATEATEGEDGNHGQIVSTVAHCAPRGKDEVFGLLEGVSNHGNFVKPAAHGDTLGVSGTDYDLSTLGGAEALCTALDELSQAQQTDATATDEDGDGHGKGKKQKKTKRHGRHATTGS